MACSRDRSRRVEDDCVTLRAGRARENSARRRRILLGSAARKLRRVAPSDPELGRVDHALANLTVGDLEDEIRPRWRQLVDAVRTVYDERAVRVEDGESVRDGTRDIRRVDAEHAGTRACRVRQRSEHVEDRARAEFAAHRCCVAHRWMVERRKHEPEPERVDRVGDPCGWLLERKAERLEHVRGSRNGADRTVSVLGDRGTGSCGDDGGRRRDVERPRTVTPGSDHIDDVCPRRMHREHVRPHRLGTARDLVRRLSLGPQRHEKAADLRRRGLPGHDLVHHLARLLAPEVVPVEELLDRGLDHGRESYAFERRPYDLPVPTFVPGLELARAFYEDVVSEFLGDTTHSAARVGWGSDVLGFDTERSTDHGWGLRLQVFVEPGDVESVRREIDASLPDEFQGWPTRFGWDDVPVSHHVEVDTLDVWLQRHLGFDARRGISTLDWLATPQQIFLEITAGAVFHDGTGELTATRESLDWYPDDVWLWLMACQWQRLDQEEPFAGRTAEVGDEVGSRILASRLVRDAMRLCFLQERQYAPYGKWLGSAFRTLDRGGTLADDMLGALSAPDDETRESALVAIAMQLARRHNLLGITAAVDESVGPFYSRPYRVLGSRRFVDACLERVRDPWLRALPAAGSVDQWVDSTDVLSESLVFPGTRATYDVWSRRS